MTWKEAYLQQSFSDYKIYQDFQKRSSEIPFCHQLHYLQMATEKFAKSQLCHGSKPPEMTHQILVKYLKNINLRPEIKNQIGFKEKEKKFNNYIESMILIAKQIEQLAPSGKDLTKPNPEYPWKRSLTNDVVSPLNYEFINFKNTHINMIKFIGFFKKLIISHGYSDS
jgi:hypothetical protein